MTEQIHPHATPYTHALCNLAGCGEPLHIVWELGMPVYLSMTADELASPAGAYTATWHVECEAGHTILVPPDTAEDFYEFGKCKCDGDPDMEAGCQHNDLARLRRVLRAPDDDGICRKEDCPNLGGVWMDCP